MKINKVLVIHGPNLNLLGTREPEIYGSMTMQDINEDLAKQAKEHNIEIDFFKVIMMELLLILYIMLVVNMAILF